MPFEFNQLLSLDFPALCLQCLEPPPTLFSSTPHPTSTSWSLAPPGEKQKEALSAYFQELFRKRKASCTAAIAEELTFPSPQAAAQRENIRQALRNAKNDVETLEVRVAEHLASALQVWEQLPAHRQQELWTLEMARAIGRRRHEVDNLKETQQSLKQENANLRAQIDQLNRLQQPKEFRVVPPMTMKVDEKIMELWTEAGASGSRGVGLSKEDRHSDLSTVVSGAIDRWKNVIVAMRAASGMGTQRPLDDASVPPKTPASATHPATPMTQQAAHQQQQHQGRQTQYPQTSPHVQASGVRNTSVSSSRQTVSEPKSSVASTPVQSPVESGEGDGDDSEGDRDADGDADADADIEMEGGHEYLSAASTATHHNMPQMAQLQGHQIHRIHPSTRSQDQHMTTARHGPYPPRTNNYGSQDLLPNQQVHMSQQAFGHQMQSLEQHLAQGHGASGMGWTNH